jgi:hypothetical protein
VATALVAQREKRTNRTSQLVVDREGAFPEMQYCLEADVLAPSRARTLLADLSGQRPEVRDGRDDALIVLSELVTNAVRHCAGSTIDLDLEVAGEVLRIAVTQHSSLPLPPGPLAASTPAWTGESGRGLHLVDRLATRWGSDPQPDGGLRVWADVSSAH